MQEAEGGAWTGEELRVLFGMTPADLMARRANFCILSWKDEKDAFHYPQWQFLGDGGLLPGVQTVLRIFSSQDTWRVLRYFLCPRSQMDWSSPLDLLRAGKVEKVVAHAATAREEHTW